jgi:hypothetical protein
MFMPLTREERAAAYWNVSESEKVPNACAGSP